MTKLAVIDTSMRVYSMNQRGGPIEMVSLTVLPEDGDNRRFFFFPTNISFPIENPAGFGVFTNNKKLRITMELMD